MVLIRAFLAAVFCLFASTSFSQSITVLNGPTIFYKYGSPGAAGTDAPGCGTAPSNACRTCNFLYSQLLDNYVLVSGGSIAIQFSGNVHNDTCAFSGRMPGQTVPQQIEIIGGGAQAVSHTDCTSPNGSLISPSVGDAFSATHLAMFSVYCLEAENNSGGQGVFTTGQGGDIMLLGQIVSFGSGTNAGNDLTAGVQSLIELQTPTANKDAFGMSVSGIYYFDGGGQCAFDAGDLSEIVAHTNGQTGLITFNWNGGNYTIGAACANKIAVVSLEGVQHNGSINGPQINAKQNAIIDALRNGASPLPGSGVHLETGAQFIQ